MFTRLLRASIVVAAALIGFITLAICYSVVMRQGFSIVPYWVNDATGFILLTITFLGGAYVAMRDGHTRVDLVLNWLSPERRRVAETAATLICLAASLILAITAAYVMADNFARGTRVVRTIEFPKWLAILPIFVGSSLVSAVFLLKLIGAQVFGDRAETRGEL